MIKALLLILDPIRTWERIVAVRRRWQLILLFYFIPFLALVTAVEGYGIRQFGKPRGEFGRIQPVSLTQIVTYEAAQVVLSLFIIFLMARLVKSLGETFHGRHTFGQTFTVAAYGLSPILLLRLFDAFPAISPWLTWGVGMVLAAVTLYHGLPRVMLPDPPHAFGLYLVSTLLLAIVTALVRFVTSWYLQGRFTKVDAFILNLKAHWHF